MAKKVTVGLILYLGEKYFKQSLESLINQDYPDIEFLIRDQSPNGEAAEYIGKNLAHLLPKIRLERGENLFHSGGHNALINKMQGEYYFCCGYDMLYPADFVSKIVAEMEKPENKKYGSATCELMQWNFQQANPNLPEKTDNIDSFGIGLTKGNYFFDIGQGEKDQEQYKNVHEIFGASGALTVFRKEALQAIAYKNDKNYHEYYDELIHYKNDIDLAYRLQWAGFPCLLVRDLKVYHDRQVSSTKGEFKLLTILKSRRDKSSWAKKNSFFGHLVVIAKNVKGQPFRLTVKFKTWLSHFFRLLYTMFFEREILAEYKNLKKHQKEIAAKTAAIKRNVSAKELERFMV